MLGYEPQDCGRHNMVAGLWPTGFHARSVRMRFLCISFLHYLVAGWWATAAGHYVVSTCAAVFLLEDTGSSVVRFVVTVTIIVILSPAPTLSFS